MEIIKVNKHKVACEKAASLIVAQVLINPKSVIGLATGSTVSELYDILITKVKQEGVDFSQVSAFNLDEYYPIKKNHEGSYYNYMKRKLFDHITLKECHIPKGDCEDPDKECEGYELKIRGKGGIDLQLLGIGRNGHIGFNEPGQSFTKSTHLTALDSKTIEDNRIYFSDSDEMPKHAISMGIKTIMDAKKIVLIATGAKKKEAIKSLVHGEICPELPASILQLHNNVTLIVDDDAGQLL